MKCKKCGYEFDANFCPKCGEPAVKKCRSCGTLLNDDDLFCRNCGTKVGASAPQIPVAAREYGASVNHNASPVYVKPNNNVIVYNGMNTIGQIISVITLLLSILLWVFYYMPFMQFELFGSISLYEIFRLCLEDIKDSRASYEEIDQETIEMILKLGVLFFVTFLHTCSSLGMILAFSRFNSRDQRAQLMLIHTFKRRSFSLTFLSLILFVASIIIKSEVGSLSGLGLVFMIIVTICCAILTGGYGAYVIYKLNQLAIAQRVR